MPETIYIPIKEKSTMCLCDQVHRWVRGEQEYRCRCGRTYRKAADYAFFSSHLDYNIDDDHLATTRVARGLLLHSDADRLVAAEDD